MIRIVQRQKGVSLVESLIVVATLGVIVILMANLPNAMGLIAKGKQSSLAREIATKAIEDKRATNYLNLVNDSSSISDQRISLLPDGSGTISVENCSVSICPNSESIKEVAATVSWKAGGKLQTIKLKTFIGQGGLNQ